MPRVLKALAVDVSDVCPDGPVGVCEELASNNGVKEGFISWDRVYARGFTGAVIVAVGEDAVKVLLERLSRLGLDAGGSVAGVEEAEVRIADEASKGRSSYDWLSVSSDGRACIDALRGRQRVWSCCTTVDNVVLAYSVVRELCSGRECRTEEVAERIAEKAGLSQFFGSGGFDWERFFGERRVYHQHLYCPLRILRRLGLVEYERGRVRLAKSISDEELRALLSRYAGRPGARRGKPV